MTRQVAVTSVVAVVLWVIGSITVLIGIVTRVYGVPAIGLLLAMGGGVMQVRSFVLRCDARMHEAFEMGRQHQRGQDADLFTVPRR